MGEFGAVYKKRVAPVLRQHGLVESAQAPRAAREGVFGRLFAVESPADIARKQAELEGDPSWQRVTGELGRRFGGTDSARQIHSSFRIYSAPASLGVVEPDVRPEGHWRTYDAASGLADYRVFSVTEDREGSLWFATEGGASRYDGESFTNFTTQDGLPHSTVYAILQDQGGDLWFGTYGGVSRYDGTRFTTYTTRDGLAGNVVSSMLQDRHGNLWLGHGLVAVSGAGLSKFDGESFTVYTTRDGLADNRVFGMYEADDGHLWFGSLTSGVSRFDGQSFTTYTSQDGLTGNGIRVICRDKEGHLWFGAFGGVSRFDGHTFASLTTEDGLPHHHVTSICQDREGHLWFGTAGGGASRYDGQSFTNFGVEDGLAHGVILAVYEDRERYVWFCSYGGGVSRFDGHSMVTLPTSSPVTGMVWDREGELWVSTLNHGVARYEGIDGGAYRRSSFSIGEGLASDSVRCIYQDSRDWIWIGSLTGEICRYDGLYWQSFTAEDGLPGQGIFDIHEGKDGTIWFGTQGGGVCRYDGKRLDVLTMEDGLAHNDVRSIVLDRGGDLWFGTYGGGVSRCRVKETGERTWTTFTTEDGLGDNYLQEQAAFEDRDGCLWFGTNSGGVSRYDGQTFSTLTVKDGLAHNTGWSVAQGVGGDMWLGTPAGLSRYDGSVFQTLTQEDGLRSSSVWSLLQDQANQIWVGTANGATRYCPTVSVPPVICVDAVTSNQRYRDISKLAVPHHTGLTVFEFHGKSFKTRPEGMVYRCRLDGHDAGWRNTRRRRVEYQELPVGEYTFEVVAVDRDLVYSEKPGTVHLQVVPDPRDEQIDELEQRVRERTRELEDTHRELEEAQGRLISELEKELQTAHDMQMSLMPEASPRLEGFDVAGRCIPANHVGGDFFQYFLQQNTLVIALADVTGHAMEAAIPAVQFSGILKSHMELEGDLTLRFERLNRSLHGTLAPRTAICFVMGEIDLATHTLELADGGCPYPYHYRVGSGDVAELQVSSYPLGIRPDTRYPVVAEQLHPGDRLVFCSDGIVEADNSDGDLFGFEDTAEVVRTACAAGLPAEAIVSQLLGAVSAFRGDAPQSDDMTCVVVGVG